MKKLIPLSAGYHPIRVGYFNKTGDLDLKVYIESGVMKKQLVAEEILFNAK